MIGLPISHDEEYQEISLISEKPLPSKSTRIIQQIIMPFRSSEIQSRVMDTTSHPRPIQRPSLDTSFLNLPSEFHSSTATNPGLGISASKAWLRTLSTIRERKELEGQEGLLEEPERDIEGAREERRRRLRILSEVCALFALSAGLIVLVVLCSTGAMRKGRPMAHIKVYPPRDRASMGH